MSHVAHTTPYPWPYDDTIDPARTALVVTGAGVSWAERVPDDEAARSRLDALREHLRSTGVLIVVVGHEWVRSTVTAVDAPAPPIALGVDEIWIGTAGLDGFYGSALDAVLQRYRRTHLLVCGYGLETTVHGTVRRANDRGYECLTIADASLPHRTDLVAASISSIEMSGGIFGAVGATAPVIAAYPSR